MILFWLLAFQIPVSVCWASTLFQRFGLHLWRPRWGSLLYFFFSSSFISCDCYFFGVIRSWTYVYLRRENTHLWVIIISFILGFLFLFLVCLDDFKLDLLLMSVKAWGEHLALLCQVFQRQNRDVMPFEITVVNCMYYYYYRSIWWQLVI